MVYFILYHLKTGISSLFCCCILKKELCILLLYTPGFRSLSNGVRQINLAIMRRMHETGRMLKVRSELETTTILGLGDKVNVEHEALLPQAYSCLGDSYTIIVLSHSVGITYLSVSPTKP